MFFWIDGNETGDGLWRILSQDDGEQALMEAVSFSLNINIARCMLKSEVVSIGAKVILDGGDDLLFWIDDDISIDVSSLRRIYHEQTGSSCKIAQGDTLQVVATRMKKLKNGVSS